MNVLYIAQTTEDYLSDSIFHGLLHLDVNVVDYNKLWYMWSENLRDDTKGLFYGLGFSLYGTVPGTGSHIDRTDIQSKIRNRFFDYVIYGNPWRCMDLWGLVSTCYPASRIAIIDGEDVTHINQLSNRAVYFKRELVNDNAKPIGFSIPKDKIAATTIDKTKIIGTVLPGIKSTYSFTNEQDYYGDYLASHFGVTCKKSGWDCLRHYEIMANRCVPLFLNLEKCPDRTLHFLPKDLLISYRDEVMGIFGDYPAELVLGRLAALPIEEFRQKVESSKYNDVLDQLLDNVMKHLTTEAMAAYLLGEMTAQNA